MDNSVNPAPAPAKAPELNPDLSGVSLDDLYHQAIKLHDSNALPNAELNKVAAALAQVQEILNEHNSDHFIVRQARLSDIDSLDNMVRYWAQQGENLPRPREDLIRNIQSFAVCVKNGQVMGCACLYVYDTPQFFAKVGFTKTTIEALPEKIRKDCDNCPKRERCDEVAYEYNFGPEKSLIAKHTQQLSAIAVKPV